MLKFFTPTTDSHADIKVREVVATHINGQMYEQETGMPAITQWMLPADEMYKPKPVGGGE